MLWLYWEVLISEDWHDTLEDFPLTTKLIKAPDTLTLSLGMKQWAYHVLLATAFIPLMCNNDLSLCATQTFIFTSYLHIKFISLLQYVAGTSGIVIYSSVVIVLT